MWKRVPAVAIGYTEAVLVMTISCAVVQDPSLLVVDCSRYAEHGARLSVAAVVIADTSLEC